MPYYFLYTMQYIVALWTALFYDVITSHTWIVSFLTPCHAEHQSNKVLFIVSVSFTGLSTVFASISIYYTWVPLITLYTHNGICKCKILQEAFKSQPQLRRSKHLVKGCVCKAHPWGAKKCLAQTKASDVMSIQGYQRCPHYSLNLMNIEKGIIEQHALNILVNIKLIL